MDKILLKGGRLIEPTSGIDDIADILISNSLVEAINPGVIPKGTKIIDVSGKYVFPGFVDMHVHGREPGEEYKEDIESVTLAAASGGFTSIVLMANTVPPIDSADRISLIYDRSIAAHVWIYPVGAVTKNLDGIELTELADMTQAGAIAFSDDGKAITDAEVMRNALTYTSQLDIPILVHEIDPILAKDGQIHDGNVASLTGMKGIPTQAETMMITRDIALLSLAGGKLHVQHVSAGESLEPIRQAKSSGVNITCEVTPHHLLLTDVDVLESSFHSHFKMMPPLRSKEDVSSLWDGITDGTIDVIATDHAPHAIHEKDNPFDQTPFGVIGLETAVSLIWDRFVKTKKITTKRMVELMSVNPAKILNLPAGTINPEAYADITVFDPEITWTVDSSKFRSKSRNTPFEEWKLTGKVVMTIVAGEIVYKG